MAMLRLAFYDKKLEVKERQCCNNKIIVFVRVDGTEYIDVFISPATTTLVLHEHPYHQKTPTPTISTNTTITQVSLDLSDPPS